MRAYVDSDVLIAFLRGERRAKSFLRRLERQQETELWIGAVQRAELVFFMRAAEQARTVAFLARFRTAPVTQDIVDVGGALYRRWHASHGVDVNDALLAAMAMTSGGRVYTLNAKHFPMPEVSAKRAW